MPEADEINQVALGYQEAVSNAKKMSFTTVTPEHIYTGIKDSYPFHPSIRDLYARFKENPGFQQTRGLIRLMRQIVTGLYADNGKQAKNKCLINVFDFDLNDRSMLTTVSQIKPELSNAIAHDIASNGKAIAEEIDAQYQQKLVADVSKLILVASLANVPNALLGLTLSEVVQICVNPVEILQGSKELLMNFK